MALGLMFCCGKGFDWEEGRESNKGWRVFSIKELLCATNNFNFDNKLGEGCFGSVYWGQLWDGSEIVVKRLKSLNEKEEMEFVIEIERLARVRHKNLLNLRGYCVQGREHLIVSDFMPNLSLHSHLYGHLSSESVLDCKRRMAIAIGSAEGIAYLHNHRNHLVLHRDIKARNILLDSDFHPRVADFGLAKIIQDGATKEKGNVGYLAPEHATLGMASESSDVYSFGIVLLELVSGRRALQKLNSGTDQYQTITEWAIPLAHQGNFTEIADPKLGGDINEEELRRIVSVALVSIQQQAEKRPTMLEVVEMLKGEDKHKLTQLQQLFKNWQSACEW